jgi:hypothetical protein
MPLGESHLSVARWEKKGPAIERFWLESFGDESWLISSLGCGGHHHNNQDNNNN